MEERQEKKGSPAQTNPKKKKRKAPKKPHETSSPRQTDDAAERQDETSEVEDQRKAEVKDVEMDTDDEKKRQMGHSDVAAESQKSPETNKLDDLRQDDVEPKRSSVERDADDGNKGQMRQNDTDEVQKTSDEALNSQTGGKERAAETGKNVLDDEVRSETEPEREPSNREKLREEKDDRAVKPECERFGSHDKDDKPDGEISHIRDMKTDENCGTATEVENSVDVKAQDNLNVNVGEQSKDSSEQHLAERAKTEKEEQRVTPLQGPHHGLYNQGATCDLNSVLQVLFMTTEIHDRLDQQTDQELREIFTDLKTKTCRTENITKSLKIENVHEQRDAAECLQEILHHISKEASEVFQGQLRYTTKCSKDHIITEETSSFWTLPLSLKHTPDTTYSVESSFESTFQERKYTSDNMVYCNDCKQKTGATSRCEMVKAPQILILLLKRFVYDYTTRSHFKSDCCVEVPCELMLKNKTYKLYGMVNHMGSLRGGHYTATVLSEDNTWYECNDSHVSKVKHQLFAEDRTFSSRTVYLLTYRATELEMPCKMKQNEEDQVQTRNDNKELNHQTEGEEDNTEENSNNKSEELKETNSKDSCERLDSEAKTEREKQGVTPPQRRHHGLYNQGATCYLNSVLQVLFMTTEIHDRLDPQTDQELRQIFTDLRRKTCGTKNITRSLKIENVHEQRDAAECLQEILHHISKEASEVFQGQLMDTTKCSKGHTINEETKPFWTLPLSLKDTPDTTYSVESSFKRTFETKKYSSDNMVYCNDCKQKTGATSRCEMVEAPQILILLLKRFVYDYNTMSHFKSDCCVEVPCELQLENKTYKLYGMVNHMGSLRAGHYTAIVLSEDNTWYECNDSHVSEVKHQLFAEDRTFSSRTVYLLTYKATELEMSCETRQTEEGEVQTRSDNKVLNHQTEGEEDNAEEHLNNKPEGSKETGTVWGKLKNWLNSVFQKKRFSSSKATECQKPVETPTEDPTDKEKEEQGDDIGPEDPKKLKEPKRNSEIKTDDKETTQMGHSAEDEGQLKKDSKEERHQARGKGGDTTVSEVKSSEDEEAQENEDSNTRKNSESAEFKESRL